MKRLSTLVLAVCLGAGLVLVRVPASTAVVPRAATPAATPATPATPAAQAGDGKPKPKRFESYQGPFFNDPHRKNDHYTIESKVVNTLRHVPRGGMVRMAIYSFDRIPVANAIIAAHKRGVKIQMLLNDHQDTRAMKMVRAVIGHNRYAKSFIYKCHEGCRTKANEFNNLHSKFYLFSDAGKSSDIIAVGSANMTKNADYHQWNDLYFMSGNAALYSQFIAVFKDMKHDYETRQPTISFCGTPVGAQCDDSVDKYTVSAFPVLATPKNDPVLTMLSKIQCLTPDGAGGMTRTKLDLAMHTMRGKRGDYLAAAIRKKYAEGCDFRVDYGLIGYHTKQIIGAPTPRGRIPLRSTGLDYHPDDDFDLNHDGEDDVILDFYSHQKYFVIQGTYNGVPNTNMVLTGSSNWASLSTANDEIFMTIQGKSVVKKYEKNFNFEWYGKGNSRPAYTTTYTNFRIASQLREEDGSVHTVYKTVRRPVVTVERDPYRAGGRHWEGD